MVECSDASGGASGDTSQEGESTGCEDEALPMQQAATSPTYVSKTKVLAIIST